MSTAYKGRHTGGDNREAPAAGKARTTVHWASHTFRRPLASAGALLAVAAISAAGSSEAAPSASAPRYTPSPMAMAQSAQLSQNRNDTNTALASARRSGVQRAAALTHFQRATQDAVSRSRARAAIEQVKVRAQTRERLSREKDRQAMVDRAQSDPKAIGRLLASDRGWGDGEFSCLDRLWAKESGWRWSANNGGSGAYGIPQSLPGSKMASAGSDWQTNPVTQIKWGLQYIANSYGTPCSAWGHSQAVNWY